MTCLFWNLKLKETCTFWLFIQPPRRETKEDLRSLLIGQFCWVKRKSLLSRYFAFARSKLAFLDGSKYLCETHIIILAFRSTSNSPRRYRGSWKRSILYPPRFQRKTWSLIPIRCLASEANKNQITSKFISFSSRWNSPSFNLKTGQ